MTLDALLELFRLQVGRQSATSRCLVTGLLGAVATLLLALTAEPAYALSAPTISPNSGSYAGTQTVTMSAAAGTIYFTTDGTVPTNLSNQYTTGVAVNTPTQFNAVAYQSGTYSSVTTAFIDVDPLLAPIIQSSLILRLNSNFGASTNGFPGSVGQWYDLSGANNHAVGSAGSLPSLQSLAPNSQAVNFNGTSQYLSLPSGFANFTSGASVFLVVAPSAPTTGARFFDLGNGSASNNIYMSEPSTTGAAFHVLNGSTDSSVSSSTAVTVGQFQLLEGTYSGTNTATLFTNGSQDAQSTTMQTANNTTRSQNYIGQGSGGGNYYSGNIAELLIYSAQLTTTQKAAVEAYLMQKYQTLSVTPPAPIISVPTSTLNGPTQISISYQPGTITYITLDGSTPSSASLPYAGNPITVNFTQTIKAISFLNGVASSVASSSYTLDSSQFPAPSPSDMTAPTINLQLPVQSQ